jgi:hypothetical protein
MGFYSGYTGSRVGQVLAGLGKLTAPGSTAPSKDARRVVAAFVRGEPARGACNPKKGCDIVATGSELKVGNYVLAKRPASQSAHISVCIPDRAEMVTLKSGKKVEARGSQDVRAASSALLRAIGTGFGVRTDKDGIRRLVGAHGKRAAEVPGACIVTKLNKQQAAVAAAGLEASQEAISTYTKQFPTKREIAKIRKVQSRAKKLDALARARVKKLAPAVEKAARAEKDALRAQMRSKTFKKAAAKQKRARKARAAK